MSNWRKDIEASPIEFLHGELIEEFHRWRKSKTESTSVLIDGIAFTNIIATAKRTTYEKYKSLGLKNAVLLSVLNRPEYHQTEMRKWSDLARQTKVILDLLNSGRQDEDNPVLYAYYSGKYKMEKAMAELLEKT